MRSKERDEIYLDLLQEENPSRDIESELETLLDNGFTRKEALRRLRNE